MAPNPIASGGAISWINNGNGSWEEIHRFTSSGTFALTEAVIGVKILVVGGGGGGGADNGGGGGSGGISYTASASLSAASYTITVGNGGSGGSGNANGSNGGNSTFHNLYTGYGGGGGGGVNSNGVSGGCGGGAGGTGSKSGGNATKGSGGTTYGNNGGGRSGGSFAGGGGGGTAGAGWAGAEATSGGGGNGLSFDITGQSVYYGGGGGGGGDSTGGAGGAGGGGSGKGGRGVRGDNGTANTGGGGGGGSGNSGVGGTGGSGVVIIRMTVWDTFTISAAAGTGGVIIPSGTITLDKGQSQLFSINANYDHIIDSILVNGSAISITDKHSQSYTISNIQSNQTIAASFKSNFATKQYLNLSRRIKTTIPTKLA